MIHVEAADDDKVVLSLEFEEKDKFEASETARGVAAWAEIMLRDEGREIVVYKGDAPELSLKAAETKL